VETSGFSFPVAKNSYFSGMMEQETFLEKGINWLNEWTGKIISWLMPILVVLVCVDVTTRYLFDNTQTWIIELEWHLFAALFLLGAGYTLKHQRHVRVDLFYAKMGIRDKALVDFIGTLVLLIPWCILIIWVSFEYATISFLIREGSPDPGGLPARYIIKFIIPLGIGLLLLQAIALLLQSWRYYRHPETVPDESDTSLPESL
jgi:TRAP-type mannitol/chloroaromatic compound transport system permease small subunit